MVVKTFSVVKNIKTLKHCESLFRASNEMRLLNLMNYFEQVFSMRTAIK